MVIAIRVQQRQNRRHHWRYDSKIAMRCVRHRRSDTTAEQSATSPADALYSARTPSAVAITVACQRRRDSSSTATITLACGGDDRRITDNVPGRLNVRPPNRVTGDLTAWRKTNPRPRGGPAQPPEISGRQSAAKPAKMTTSLNSTGSMVRLPELTSRTTANRMFFDNDGRSAICRGQDRGSRQEH